MIAICIDASQVVIRGEFCFGIVAVFVIVYGYLYQGVVGGIYVVLVECLAIEQGITGLCLSGKFLGSRDSL